MSFCLISSQMTRVISSPCISTTDPALILAAIVYPVNAQVIQMLKPVNSCAKAFMLKHSVQPNLDCWCTNFFLFISLCAWMNPRAFLSYISIAAELLEYQIPPSPCPQMNMQMSINTFYWWEFRTLQEHIIRLSNHGSQNEKRGTSGNVSWRRLQMKLKTTKRLLYFWHTSVWSQQQTLLRKPVVCH